MGKNRIFLLVAALVLAGFATARADAPHARMIANDPAFDSLVNQDMLHEAAFGNDAGVMVDAAIMLERAEQQLHRPHRGGTADDMFRHAWQTALANHDDGARERIVQHLEYYERTALLDELKAMQPPTHFIPPKRPTYGGGSEQELYDDFMAEAEDALRRLDTARVEELRRQVGNPNCPLTDKDRSDVNVYLEKIGTKIFQATHNEDGSEKQDVRRWGWGHGPQPTPPPPAPEEPANSWGPQGPHFGPIAPPPAENRAPYRSARLKALFSSAPHGAKIEDILPGSPLNGRLRVGDIITSLDNVPVNSTWELENHHSVTKVHYMDNRGVDRVTVIRIR